MERLVKCQRCKKFLGISLLHTQIEEGKGLIGYCKIPCNTNKESGNRSFIQYSARDKKHDLKP